MKKNILAVFLILCLSAAASELPFIEPFEASSVTNGALNSQNGWTASGTTATVQTNVVQTGSQALQIQNAQITHALSNSSSSVWVRFQARITAKPAANPSVSNANTSVAFYINTNLNLVVYSNQTAVTLAKTIQTNVWTRFDIYCDYDNLKWTLSVNGTNVAQNLPLFSGNRQMESVLIANSSTNAVYFDELAVQETEPTGSVIDTDGDSIPDWWEQRYFGGITNSIATGIASNGLTYLQSYLANLDPGNPDDKLAITMGTGRKFNWIRKPDRQYEVYWTSNLTSGFTYIQTVAGSEFEDTNTVRTTKESGFYQIRVRP